MTALAATLLPMLAKSGIEGVIVMIVIIVISIIASVAQQQEKNKKGSPQARRRNPRLRYGDEGGADPRDGSWERIEDIDAQPQPPPDTQVLPAPLNTLIARGRRAGRVEAPPARDPYDLVEAVDYNDSPTHQSPAAPRAQRARRAQRQEEIHAEFVQTPADGERRKRKKRRAESLDSGEPSGSTARTTGTGSTGKSGREGSGGLIPDRISPRDAARGLIMAELLGKPLALRPYDSERT